MQNRVTAYRSAGFTLIEMLAVIAVVGIVAMLAAPTFRGTVTTPNAQQLNHFAHSAASNWRLINMTCGTSNNTATSTIVTTPSVANTLALIVNGSTYVRTTFASCYAESGVVPLHSKATGNPTDGFRVANYPVTWSGGSGTNTLDFVFTGVLVEEALILYRQLSSATGATTATAMPATADTTDAAFRFTAPTGGTTTITLRIP